MDGLIEACVEIKNRIDAKVEHNSQTAKALPIVDGDLKETEAGKYLAQLSGNSSLERRHTLIAKLDRSTETIHELNDQQTRPRSADTPQDGVLLPMPAGGRHVCRTHL